MPSIPIVRREPPPWLTPPVETDRDGIRSHRIYKPGDAWYATRVAYEGRWLWCMFGDGAPLNLPEDVRVEPIVRVLGNYQPITLASEHESVVAPIVVVLPNFGGTFCVHSPVMRAGVYGSSGWKVEGNLEDLPNFSVHPSIDMGAIWHGHIQRGLLVW